MVQLSASKSSPCDRTKHPLSKDLFKNLVLVGTHLVAAPGVITPGGAPRRGTDGRTGASPQATAPRIHSFLGVVLQILLFGIHLVAADGMHFI